jgi:glycosyltransferase involved in cell wall biosynthesis
MSSKLQPLVSVVTPMYNEEKHLAECIESIIGQTYQNWEYIIVNNYSTDASAEIARQYAAKDPRIRVSENKTFLRAIPNHNAALTQISPASKYCKIVFADDWIFPECLERMVAVAEAHPSVGLVGAYGLEGEQVVWTGLPYPSAMVSGQEICRRLFIEGLYVFGTATSLLYRSDLVRQRAPFYNELNIHSDMETCIALLTACDFGFVHQVLTFTRVRENSRITISRNINTVAASNLYHLATYGREFLDHQEYAACLNRSLAGYYSYLAASRLRRRDKSFWEYHTKTLRDAGVGFSKARLARAMVVTLAGAVLNPKESIARLLRPKTDESKAFAKDIAESRQEPLSRSEAQQHAK